MTTNSEPSPAASALYELVTLPETTFTVEPLSLSIGVQYRTGTTSIITLTRDDDLRANGGESTRVLKSANGGLVLGLGLDDGEADAILFQPSPGTDVREVLKQGIEALAVALEATTKTACRSSVGR